MPQNYLFKWAPDAKYTYFTSTAGSQCSYRNLDENENNSLILEALITGDNNEKYLLRREMREEKKIALAGVKQ